MKRRGQKEVNEFGLIRSLKKIELRMPVRVVVIYPDGQVTSVSLPLSAKLIITLRGHVN